MEQWCALYVFLYSYERETFKMSPVAENKVAKIIEILKDSATGWDDLRPLRY